MTHRNYRNWLALLALFLMLPARPVQAANTDYRIDIHDNEAMSLQELDITEHDVSEGDIITHHIYVDNHTSNGHIIKIKNIEVVQDSILLDKLSFEFINGAAVVPFDSGNFSQAYDKNLFVVGSQGTGNFTLRMTVNGNLDNSYQGSACTLRYTFEILNLEAGGIMPVDGGVTPPPSNQNGGQNTQGNQGQTNTQGNQGQTNTQGTQAQTDKQGGLPTTLGNAVKALLPNTGEGKLAVTSMLGLIVSLSVFLVVKNRKKETPPTKE